MYKVCDVCVVFARTHTHFLSTVLIRETRKASALVHARERPENSRNLLRLVNNNESESLACVCVCVCGKVLPPRRTRVMLLCCLLAYAQVICSRVGHILHTREAQEKINPPPSSSAAPRAIHIVFVVLCKHPRRVQRTQNSLGGGARSSCNKSYFNALWNCRCDAPAALQPHSYTRRYTQKPLQIA